MPRIQRLTVPGVALHAYVCVTNHVHILVTPWDEGSVSLLTQRHHTESLGDYPVRPRLEWLALGSDADERRHRYAELVAEGLREDNLALFRRCAYKGLPTGSDRFRREIEAALVTRIGDGRRGRPKKGL